MLFINTLAMVQNDAIFIHELIIIYSLSVYQIEEEYGVALLVICYFLIKWRDVLQTGRAIACQQKMDFLRIKTSHVTYQRQIQRTFCLLR